MTTQLSATELALRIFPFFAKKVLARDLPPTYGYYAKCIGRDPGKEAITVGSAMHAIGAVCLILEIPVAPLYWVKRADGERRQIFASDPLEDYHILHLGRYDTMFVAAREYRYSAPEFERVREVLEKITREAPADWTPHVLWRKAILETVQGKGQTYLKAAMCRYEQILCQLRANHAQSRGPHTLSTPRQSQPGANA